jgi:hypothetical protein
MPFMPSAALRRVVAPGSPPTIDKITNKNCPAIRCPFDVPFSARILQFVQFRFQLHFEAFAILCSRWPVS